jgi:hypothetical protein
MAAFAFFCRIGILCSWKKIYFRNQALRQ